MYFLNNLIADILAAVKGTWAFNAANINEKIAPRALRHSNITQYLSITKDLIVCDTLCDFYSSTHKSLVSLLL